ncbi:MAG: hypothetical protein IKF39_01605 [Oscillospiraceae bacterium]|nr:hypothetical protein [Oscillospiraceae bacterium]
MALMEWKYSNGFDPSEFATSIAIEDDYELKDIEKDVFLAFTCSAASKSIVLGLEAGQFMVVANIGGTNAVTVKAIKGDTGTSVAAGKVALVIASATANASKIYVLN